MFYGGRERYKNQEVRKVRKLLDLDGSTRTTVMNVMNMETA